MRRVVFSRAAQVDLEDLFDWILERAGREAATRYAQGLREYCRSFARFPHRGTRRDDLRPGLRTIGFRRQVLIAFAVTRDEVVFLRLLYGGRSLDRALRRTGKD